MAKIDTTTNKVTFESTDTMALDNLRSQASGLETGDLILFEKGAAGDGSSAMKIPVENFAAYAGKKITMEANAEAFALVETFQKAEDERIAAETARQKQEDKRQTDTKTAISNSEEQTKACKTATDLAKELNAHPDYIGDDGYWYVWNVEKDVYENTNKLGAGGIVYPTFYVDDDFVLHLVYNDEVGASMFHYDEDTGILYFRQTNVAA